jgi:hypothetical protein
LDFLRVAAGFEFDALGFQKPVHVLVEFVFLQSFHKRSLTEGILAQTAPAGNYRSVIGL